MYEYTYTVMIRDKDQNSQPPNRDKTWYYYLALQGQPIKSHQSCMIDTFFCFSSLACLSTSIMSKDEPSMGELRLDYNIHCPAYLE
jgi:hypothetical protein